MKRKNFKYFLLLLFSMFVSEILNGIVYLISYCYIDWEWLVEKSFMLSNIPVDDDVISRIIVAIFAMISYIFIGKKIFCKFTDRKYKQKAASILSFIIVLSYLSCFLCDIGWFLYSTHWSMCSPITYVLLLPFIFMEEPIPMLGETLFMLLSSIPVLLIWMFSEIGNRKKTNTADNSCIEEN